MHTTASYRLCSILDCLIRWSDTAVEMDAKQELTAVVYREAKRVLDIYQANLSLETTNLEILNLLITLHRLIGFKLPPNQICSLFSLNPANNEGYSKLNYFQLCTLLYLIEQSPDYSLLRDGIENEIIARMNEPKQLLRADNAYMFFDIMTCPYISKSTCFKVIEQTLSIKNQSKIGKTKNELAQPKRWFFDWDKSHSLTEFLKKKEYRSPYE